MRVELDEAALEDLLNGPDGPVGEMLQDLAVKMTTVAKAAAPTQKMHNHSWHFASSTSYMPWATTYLKGNIRPHMGYTSTGKIFAGVNAPYGPTLFLQYPTPNWKTRVYIHGSDFMEIALDSAAF